jgi:tetratricopeptide (TPR) repeat protein
MKVVHRNDFGPEPGSRLEQAKFLEKMGELSKAAAAYEMVTKQHPKNEFAYDRLMIIYRKMKEYDKELAVINRAIKVYRQSLSARSKLNSNRKLVTLSKSLLRSLKMVDEKGEAIYDAEPVARWKKRKTVVENKLDKHG